MLDLWQKAGLFQEFLYKFSLNDGGDERHSKNSGDKVFVVLNDTTDARTTSICVGGIVPINHGVNREHNFCVR